MKKVKMIVAVNLPDRFIIKGAPLRVLLETYQQGQDETIFNNAISPLNGALAVKEASPA